MFSFCTTRQKNFSSSFQTHDIIGVHYRLRSPKITDIKGLLIQQQPTCTRCPCRLPLNTTTAIAVDAIVQTVSRCWKSFVVFNWNYITRGKKRPHLHNISQWKHRPYAVVFSKTNKNAAIIHRAATVTQLFTISCHIHYSLCFLYSNVSIHALAV